MHASVAALAQAGVPAPVAGVVLLQLQPPGTASELHLKNGALEVPYPESFKVLVALALNADGAGSESQVNVLLPRSAFDRIADHVGARRIDSLSLRPGDAADDVVLVHLGASLGSAIGPGISVERLLIDELASALTFHIAWRFGRMEAPKQTARGGLAPWQLSLSRKRLDQHLSGDLRLDEIAAECGLTTSYFTRAFSASTGVPPHRWLNHRRVERAKAMILSDNIPLAQIAHACGFSDQSHFTRVFSSLVGIPPARWRVVQEQV
jgi:AraC-like DNA-binding protein